MLSSISKNLLLKVLSLSDTAYEAVGPQRDLDALSLWCQRNCLFLNIEKCKTISFHQKCNKFRLHDWRCFLTSHCNSWFGHSWNRIQVKFSEKNMSRISRRSNTESIYCAHVRSPWVRIGSLASILNQYGKNLLCSRHYWDQFEGMIITDYPFPHIRKDVLHFKSAMAY